MKLTYMNIVAIRPIPNSLWQCDGCSNHITTGRSPEYASEEHDDAEYLRHRRELVPLVDSMAWYSSCDREFTLAE